MASTVTAQEGQVPGVPVNLVQRLIPVFEHELNNVYWRHPDWFMDRIRIEPPILLHPIGGPAFMLHNRMLFALMQHTLPREVRDLIWAQVWDEEEIEEYLTHMRNTIQSTCLSCVKPLDLHCPYHLQLPYFLRPRLVGLDMARELLESWYSIATTSDDRLLYAFEPGGVKEIICKDAFNVGFDPAQFLKKLEINMSVNSFVPPKGGEADYCGIRSVEHRRELITEPLLRIQHKSGFKLTIKVDQKHIRLNRWREVFDALREPVRVMKAEGATVKASFIYRTRGYWDEETVSYDIIEAMLQPEEEWRAKAVAFLDAQPDIADIHRLYRDENSPDFNPESDIYLTEEEIEQRIESERDAIMYPPDDYEPSHDHLREYLTTGTLKHEEGVCQCPECKSKHGETWEF